MKSEELEKIFIDYLKRKPNDGEYKWHQHKDPAVFITEVLKCDEYKKLNEGLKLPRVKIAVLLSGHIRHNSVKDSLKLLSGFDYDVFIHTWDNMGFKGRETNLNDSVDYQQIERTVLSFPNVRKYKIENNKQFINGIRDCGVTYYNYSSPEKFIKSQLYSINQSYEIFENYYKENDITYDVVIKLRFDTPFTLFSLDMGTVDVIKNNKIIYTPNKDCNHIHPDSNSTTCQVCETMFHTHGLRKVHNFNHSNVICDIFAYGDVESMKHYCSLYDVYDTINKSFEESNNKIITENNIEYTKEHDSYVLTKDVRGHLNSLYYVNCSYPERLLNVHLSDYLLPTSTKIKVKFIR